MAIQLVLLVVIRNVHCTPSNRHLCPVERCLELAQSVSASCEHARVWPETRAATSSVGTRSAASSPAPAPSSSGGAHALQLFNGDLLRTYMKKLLASTLGAATWSDPRERDKERMLGAFALPRVAGARAAS
jgi:hypothetical protein